MKVLSKSTAKRRTVTKKSKKKVSFLSRFQGLSKKAQLLVFGIVFAAIGGGYYLYQSMASDGLPDKANQLVISYEVGMAHPIVDDNFSTMNSTSMLLYGNGLLLCSGNDMGVSSTATAMDMSGWRSRQLSRDEVHTLVNQLKSNGFNKAVDDTKMLASAPVGDTRYLSINSAGGADTATTNSQNKSANFSKAESVIAQSCAATMQPYQPDDVITETIKLPADHPDAAKATETLPGEADVDQEVKVVKNKELKGKDAKVVKAKLSTAPKVYKQGDQVVRARYVYKIPDYEALNVKKESNKGKVSAAAALKTRWIIVVAKDQDIPTWATKAYMTGNATDIQNWYKSRVGKTFDISSVSVVHGSKTRTQYKTCPSAPCGYQYTPGVYSFPQSDAVIKNLRAEFNQAGYSTNILTTFATSEGCVGMGDQPPSVTEPGSGVAYVPATATFGSGGCWSNAIIKSVAAHELGHNFGLMHTCDTTLMSPGTSNCPQSPNRLADTSLNAGQVPLLRDISPYFNLVPPTPPVPANLGPFGDSIVDSSGRVQIFVRGTDLQLYGRGQTAANTNNWGGGYYGLGGIVNSNIAAVNNQNGSMQLFHRGTDNKLYTMAQPCPTCSFGGWMQIGGAATVSSDPKAVLGNDGRIRVFINSNTIGAVLTQNTANDISSWPTSYTFLPGPALSSNITVAKNKDGRIQAFARTYNYDVVTYLANSDYTFTRGWVSLGGGITSDVAVTAAGDGRLYIFVRGLDKQQTYVNYQNSTTDPLSWSGYTSLGGIITSNIAAISNADGRVQIFVRGLDAALYTNYQTCPSCGFGGWVGLGGVNTSDPSVIKLPDGRLEVFMRGNPDGGYAITQNTANGSFTAGSYIGLSGNISPVSALNMINQ